MPHERKRYAEERIHKIVSYSPIVGVLGQRQVGKTTLLERSAQEYTTFDQAKTLNLALQDPALFLLGHQSPFGIDEAQMCAPLFSALKEHVRTHKKKGQFILSGSVRFTSKQSIRESLTGRIVSTEILPFTIAEINERPLPDSYRQILGVQSKRQMEFIEKSKTQPSHFEHYLAAGGLPGICFYRDPSIRNDKFEAQIDTLLNRDLRTIYPTTLPFAALYNLLEHLAHTQGEPFEWKAASRASQISTITLKRVLFAFEAMFLIRLVPTVGEQKGTYFFEDQGMATWLTRGGLNDPSDLIRGLYANLRQEVHYRPALNARIFQWRTRNGSEVPLAFSSPLGTLGILPTLDNVPTPKIMGSAAGFLKKFRNSKVIIAYGGSDVIFKTPSLFWIPFSKLC